MQKSWLLNYRRDITSQSGQDGIIEKIFNSLDIREGFCVDVGAYGYRWSNVYSLITKGWGAVLIEHEPRYYRGLRRLYKTFNNVLCVEASVEISGDNTLDKILDRVTAPKVFDFLNIDIDSYDYQVWESLKEYEALVVDIEVDFRGASLLETIDLGVSKGYEFLCSTENNAFFVRQDLTYKVIE